MTVAYCDTFVSPQGCHMVLSVTCYSVTLNMGVLGQSEHLNGDWYESPPPRSFRSRARKECPLFAFAALTSSARATINHEQTAAPAKSWRVRTRQVN